MAARLRPWKGLAHRAGRAFGLWLLLAGLAGIAAAQPTNVLLIVSDDVGADTLAMFNKDAQAHFPPTPNLDSLANSGVIFRNAYSYPTCTPTRSCLLTGRYGFRTGLGFVIDQPDDATLQPGEFTLPEAFQANPQLGVRHASVGKWHLSWDARDPNTIGGWPHFSGELYGAIPDYSNWEKVVDGVTTSNYTVYATTDNANDALAWIGAQGTNSWMLWLAFNASHTPYHKPPNNLHSYDNLPTNETYISAHPRPYYEAALEAMDTEIGRVLAGVNRSNTTIIFLGDNGSAAQVIQPPYSGTRGKGTLYEGGIHVPLLIAGPTVVRPHRESTNVVHLVDLYATILELTGVNVSQTLPADRRYDSRSLVPILKDAPFTPAETCVLAESFGPNAPALVSGRAVRNERHKLIQFQGGRQEFYDLWSDPVEQTNLLSGTLTTGQQAAYDALVAKLAAWQEPWAPQIASWSRATGEFKVTVPAAYGVRYGLERANTLASGSWTNATEALAVTNGSVVELTDPTDRGGQQFYRVNATKP